MPVSNYTYSIAKYSHIKWSKRTFMKAHIPTILAINVGSSSIKFALFESRDRMKRIASGEIERIGLPHSWLNISADDDELACSRSISAVEHLQAFDILMEWLEMQMSRRPVDAIGHRIVRGGPSYSLPVKISVEMLEDLQNYAFFDPQHLPSDIVLVNLMYKKFQNVPQVACFDTAFYRNLPRVARILPIPRRYEEEGLRPNGIHGLSYAFLLRELEGIEGNKTLEGKVVLAHLGSSASIAALNGGNLVDSTVGLSPGAGLPAALSSGDVDPGLFSYFASSEGLDARGVVDMFNRHSGLKGISETSTDMRDLLAWESMDIRAAEAVDFFCYRVKKGIGAFAAVLGGVDALVFSGGIGAHCPAIRSRMCQGMDFLGIGLDESLNSGNAAVISKDTMPATVRVIHTDEEIMIAESVAQVLSLAS